MRDNKYALQEEGPPKYSKEIYEVDRWMSWTDGLSELAELVAREDATIPLVSGKWARNTTVITTIESLEVYVDRAREEEFTMLLPVSPEEIAEFARNYRKCLVDISKK